MVFKEFKAYIMVQCSVVYKNNLYAKPQNA